MKSKDRRHFLSKMTLSASGALFMPKLILSDTRSYFENNHADEYVTIEITHGKIRGIRNKGVNIFKGVPYGGSVSGDRRFRRPAPLEPWTGVRDALELGAPSLQSGGRDNPAPAEGVPEWPAYNLKDRPTMRIDTNCTLINNRFSIELNMWRSIGKL
jgi:para-nitrobenzyl esterase